MIENFPHKEFKKDLDKVFLKFLADKDFYPGRVKRKITFVTRLEHVGKHIATNVKEEGIEFLISFKATTLYE